MKRVKPVCLRGSRRAPFYYRIGLPVGVMRAVYTVIWWAYGMRPRAAKR